jgi:lysozyme
MRHRLGNCLVPATSIGEPLTSVSALNDELVQGNAMRLSARLVTIAALSAFLMSCAGPEDRDYPPLPAANASQSAVAASRHVAVTYPAFGDFKPHPWDGRAPSAYPVHGIDVSRWQGAIDWPQVRASGIAFAFIKATEGGDHTDPLFPDNWQGAARAGVPRAAYHFYYFCRPAAEQARWFISHVPRDPAALPPVLDLEWNHTSRSCPHRPDPATVRAEAARFLDILTAHYGQRPIIYTTVDFYRDTGIGRLPNTEFWLRSVAGHPSAVYPGQRWSFWQYTGTGRIAGVTGPVDINVFSGSVADWRRWRN